jgi:dTDP-4-amino-4,6-dideoxygalactose transaminase
MPPPILKARAEDLAVFGQAPPAFDSPLHVGRPNVGRAEAVLERIGGALESRRLTNGGPLVAEFERRVAEAAGVGHCVATCNATTALEVAVRALELSGEVIVPSFTFVATVHALRWLGLTPVFCDVDPLTHHLGPRQVEERVGPATRGVLAVHLWGRTCDVEGLEDVAARHRLALLFDASHAFSCARQGRPVGGGGDAEVFSFHATKLVNTFEGGAIVTRRADVAERARRMINFGFAGYDTVVGLGINGKMSEAAAAMGLTGLDSLEAFVEANRRNLAAYRRGLHGLPGVSLLRVPPGDHSHDHYVVVEVDAAAAGISRDELLEALHAENVLARRYFYPGCHRMEPYRSEQPGAGARLPVTEALAGRVLQLPTGTAVGEEDVAAVCAVVRLALTAARAVRERPQRVPLAAEA